MTLSKNIENSDPPVPSIQPQPAVQVYQFHVLLLKTSPAIWRRFLIRSDSSLADLHYILQILMGWEDEHLHQFTIHGQHFGIEHTGGLYFSTGPTKIHLGDFHLRLKERFLYEYDLIDHWQHQLRLEKILPLDPAKTYPVCIAGSRQVPPEDSGGPDQFMEQEVKRELALWDKKLRLIEIMAALLPAIADEQSDIRATLELQRAELAILFQALNEATFNRVTINQRLDLYGSGATDWRTRELPPLRTSKLNKSRKISP